MKGLSVKLFSYICKLYVTSNTYPKQKITMQLSLSAIKSNFKEFIHNRQTLGFLFSIVVFAIISIAFFYPDNFEGNDLRQHDMIQGMANGQEIKAFEEATGEQSRWTNALFSGMPTFQIAPTYPSNSLFAWFTKIYGLGLPSPSNLLFMMMVGFMILMMTMRVRWEYGIIGAIAWGLSTYFIIIIGAGHIWKFVTLAYIPPTIGGIILAYRGRYLGGAAMAAFFAMMQLNANHIQMTYYFGFVIAVLVVAYFIKSLIERKIARWGIATASLMVAGGLAICANLPSIYHTSKYAKETQREQSEVDNNDPATADSIMRSYITQYSYGPSETFTLMIPNVKGGASVRPEAGNLYPMSLAELDGATKYSDDPFVNLYLNYSTQYFGAPEGTNGPVYVGVIIFALFVVGCIVVRGPVKWGLIFILIITILLAWGRNCQWFTDLFIDCIPMYSKFRTVESILVVAEFIIPLIAILGFYRLYNSEQRLQPNAGKLPATEEKPQKFFKRKGDIALAAGFGIVGIICLMGALNPAIFGEGFNEANELRTSEMIASQLLSQGYPEEVVAQAGIQNPAILEAVEELHYSLVRKDCIRSLVFLLLGVGAVAIWRFNLLKDVKKSRLISVGAIGLLVLIDLYAVNKRYINHESFFVPDLLSSEAVIEPTSADKQILQDTDPNYRVADFDRFGEATPSYFHKMIGGYHAAKLGRYNDLINSNLITTEPVLNMLNARYIVAGGQVYPNDLALGNAWFIDKITYVDNANKELHALNSLSPEYEAVADISMQEILGNATPGDSTDTIVETSYAPNRLTYKSTTSTDRVAVFSEIYFPWGWEATIDGKPAEIGRVNYVLRAMVIPAGTHEIEMKFNPQSVHTTVSVATIAIIIIYLLAIAAIACGVAGIGKKKE